MLLTLDVGNSAVKGGCFDGNELVRVFSVPDGPANAEESSTAAAWQDTLAPYLPDASIEQVGLASVVPTTAGAVTDALTALTGAPVTRVRPSMPLPFELAYETPDTLGADRLAAAAAGWVHFGRDEFRSVLVVDAGTAVNYEVIRRDGVYRGGAIGAGPALVRGALRRGTAQLPEVPLTLPDEPGGRSTQTALQSGIMWGLVDSVRGMADRLAQSLPDPPVRVLTGGWSALLADRLDRVDHHAPHLVLRGVQLLTTLNA
ncbi:MAG: type III pantothenate kinase [Salinibacter sp.]|uniref:type III pantothenate kinase n=1 Tax=Salinibacter sp. TaxID=2065818 RepID=UPI0035D43697